MQLQVSTKTCGISQKRKKRNNNHEIDYFSKATSNENRIKSVAPTFFTS